MIENIFKDIEAAGGSCFYTGPSLRNQLLGIPVTNYEVLVYGITPEILEQIGAKRGITINRNTYTIETNVIYAFHFISDVSSLHTLHDFTINSIYKNCLNGSIYDPHNGLLALSNRTLNITRDAILARPIRMVEGIYLSARLGFSIQVETWFNIYENARLVKYIDPTEFKEILNNILMLDEPSKAFSLLHETRILQFSIPELADCKDVIQNKRSGVRNVFQHILYALDACEKQLDLRLAILFHDIGKPHTLEIGTDGKIHFFKHEVIGSKLAKQYLRYWNYDKETIHKVSHLVLHHMFDADPRLTDKSVRRLIKKVGKEYIYDLVKVREADRKGTPEKISMKKIKVLLKKIDREIQNI